MEMSTMPTNFCPSWDGGRNYQAGSITGEKIEDTKDALGNPINTNSTMMVCQPEGKKFKKVIIKSSPFDGGKRHIELGLQSLLPRRKIEDGKGASNKHIDAVETIYQPKGKEFKKGTVNGSSFDGSETINAASPPGMEDITLGCKVASRDLKSLSLLGKGFSGIVYETIWKEERSCARKDFVHVPSDVFEREAELLVRLKGHSNVVQTIGWAVGKNCCSLVLELVDCSLRSLAQRKMLLRRVTYSGPPIDSTATKLDSECSNSPQQEIEKKMNDSNSPVSASSEAQTSSPFSIREVIHIINEVAAGMKHLHDNEVAHGDLKPANILVTLKKRAAGSSNFDESLSIETVKVTDFGIIESKSKSRCMTSVSLETRELDRIRRKAPELFDIDHGLNKNFEHLAMGDVYTYGMTVSEILSGEEPYSDLPNPGVQTLREAIKEGRRPKLPDGCLQLNELIKRCWDGKPNERPNFHHILEELEKIRAAQLPVEEKSKVVISPTSHVLETSSTRGLGSLQETPVLFFVTIGVTLLSLSINFKSQVLRT